MRLDISKKVSCENLREKTGTQRERAPWSNPSLSSYSEDDCWRPVWGKTVQSSVWRHRAVLKRGLFGKRSRRMMSKKSLLPCTTGKHWNYLHVRLHHLLYVSVSCFLSTSHSLRIGVKGAVIGLISASTDTCLNVSFLSTSWEKRKRKKTAKLGTLRSGQCPDLSHGLIRYAKPLLMVR